jgi:thiamine biosynthesis protein ThiS
MKILLNDESYEIAENTSVTMLFQKLGKEDLRGWAVAVNGNIISKYDFEKTFLREEDRVILIQAAQGG